MGIDLETGWWKALLFGVGGVRAAIIALQSPGMYDTVAVVPQVEPGRGRTEGSSLAS